MTRDEFEKLRADYNAAVAKAHAAFEAAIEAAAKTLASGNGQAPTNPAATPPAKKDADNDIQNPWIVKDPAAWKGESWAGHRADECPLDYLEVFLVAMASRAKSLLQRSVTLKEEGKLDDAEKNRLASERCAAEARAVDRIIARKKAESVGQKKERAGV
jgi:hypothetical protein